MTATEIPVVPSAPNIDAFQFQEVFDQQPRGAALVDVRTPAEFENVHIPGSHNLPLDQLPANIAQLAATDCPLVLICRSGARAEQARDQLATAGKTNVLLLSGGVEAWQASGGTVATGQRETWALDRQVRLVAGAISLTGVLASVVVPQAKWIAGGIGAGLTFSAVSNTCAMGNVLARLPYNRPSSCDVEHVLRAIEERS